MSPKPLRHGILSSYIGGGCRCVECKTVNREYYARRKARIAAGTPVLHRVVSPGRAGFAERMAWPADYLGLRVSLFALAAFLLATLPAQAQIAVNVTGAVIGLSWTASQPGYVVERAELAPAIGTNTPLTPTAAPFLAIPAYTDVDVNPGASYLYTIFAVPASGPWVTVGTFLVTLPAPGTLVEETPQFSYPNTFFLTHTPLAGILCTRNAVLQQVGTDFVVFGGAIYPLSPWLASDTIQVIYVAMSGT